MMPHGCESHRCYAAALGAVGIAAELAWGDHRLQVGGDRGGGLREDAFVRRCGRIAKLANLRIVHVELSVNVPQAPQFGDAGISLRRSKNLLRLFANLGSEDAHPDLADFRFGTPELNKLFEISLALHHLRSDGAMHGDAMTDDIL